MYIILVFAYAAHFVLLLAAFEMPQFRVGTSRIALESGSSAALFAIAMHSFGVNVWAGIATR